MAGNRVEKEANFVMNCRVYCRESWQVVLLPDVTQQHSTDQQYLTKMAVDVVVWENEGGLVQEGRVTTTTDGHSGQIMQQLCSRWVGGWEAGQHGLWQTKMTQDAAAHFRR